jgi:type I restriction enzyme S subunit
MAGGALFVGDGYRAKNEELGDGGLPFARAANVNNGFRFQGCDRFPEQNLHRVGNKISQPGDVVFTSKGTVGRFAFVRERTPRFVYAPQLCFWRVLQPDLIEPRFLYYWVHGREFFVQYSGVKAQTDMAEYVSLSDQRRMSITLPPIHEQRLIARTLGALDDKIELNRQMNETLEAMARGIFKSWFVDFDPVRAKMEGRRPFGMDAATAALFPSAPQESRIGRIPAGWQVSCLAEHVEAVKGLSYKGAGLSDHGVPLHNLNSVYEGGGYKNEGIKHYTGDFKERHVVRTGDLIVANTEQGFEFLLIGFPAMVPARYGEFGLFSHHLFRVRPQPGSPVTTHFLYHLLLTPLVRDQVVGCTNGTTVNMLYAAGLAVPAFALPPRGVISVFSDLAAKLRLKREQNYDESNTLAAVRDTLLPKLLTGEIRLKDAEKQAEAVL